MTSASPLGQALFWAAVVFSLYLHYRILIKAGLQPWWALVSLVLLGPVYVAYAVQAELQVKAPEEIRLTTGQIVMLLMPLAYVVGVWAFSFVRWPGVDDTPVQRPQGPLEPPSA